MLTDGPWLSERLGLPIWVSRLTLTLHPGLSLTSDVTFVPLVLSDMQLRLQVYCYS